MFRSRCRMAVCCGPCAMPANTFRNCRERKANGLLRQTAWAGAVSRHLDPLVVAPRHRAPKSKCNSLIDESNTQLSQAARPRRFPGHFLSAGRLFMSVKFVALAMIAAGIVCVLGAGALDGRSPVDEGLFLLASTLGFGGIIAFGMGALLLLVALFVA